ncbi:hypothetical protein, partial [Streptomyces nigrescens]|uniref:hypothetical protein n=1 Tax=Streptomyces nigrescens TaxID=1920 RepID=UPI00347EEDAA
DNHPDPPPIPTTKTEHQDTAAQLQENYRSVTLAVQAEVHPACDLLRLFRGRQCARPLGSHTPATRFLVQFPSDLDDRSSAITFTENLS